MSKDCPVCQQSEVKLIGDRSYKCPACKTRFVGDLEDGLRTEKQYAQDLKQNRRENRKMYDAICQLRG